MLTKTVFFYKFCSLFLYSMISTSLYYRFQKLRDKKVQRRTSRTLSAGDSTAGRVSRYVLNICTCTYYLYMYIYKLFIYVYYINYLRFFIYHTISNVNTSFYIQLVFANLCFIHFWKIFIARVTKNSFIVYFPR